MRAVFAVASAATFVLLITRNAYVFTAHIYEDTDYALNSILIERAEHLQLLVGNYSRVGFHHPGPAFLYVLGAGEWVFYHLLHVVPTPYNGQMLGAIVFGSILVGLISLIIYRATRSLAATAAAFTVVITFAGSHDAFAHLWFPYLYMAVFALFMVSAAAVATGRTSELPYYGVACGFLVHGHISFGMFVAVTTAVVAVGWAVRHRGRRRAEIADHRLAIRITLAALAIFALPVALQTLINYPGPWPQYLRYMRDHGDTHSIGEALRFVGWYWSGHEAPILLTVPAGIACLLLLLSERDPGLRRQFAAVEGLLALETLLFIVYVCRGVDALAPVTRYVGFFYLTVPMMLIAIAAAHLAVRVERSYHLPSLAFPLAAGVVLVVAALTIGGLSDPYRGSKAYPQITAALEANPLRDGREIQLLFPHDSWTAAAGLVISARRAHLPMCVTASRVWTNLFTAPVTCRGARDRWAVQVTSRTAWHGTGRVLWQDARIVVTDKSPSTAGPAA